MFEPLPAPALPRVTRSVCPVCLRAIPATLTANGSDVLMEKSCPDHGPFRVVVWRGAPGLDIWRRPKPPAATKAPFAGAGRGCPHDCGLCAGHRQRSCTVLMEVTERCNLRCRVCFASAGDAPASADDPSLDELAVRLSRAFQQAGPVILQISGGEPTVRDDLPQIIRLGMAAGFSHVQLNTNGLRLGADPEYARLLRAAGLGWIFLQFDGLREATHQALRGRPLLNAKLAAVDNAAAAGLGVVLVPTLVPGVNVGEVGDILRLAARLVPAVRGVHFQPVSFFGRFPHQPDAPRLTLPELLRAIEAQTGGALRAADFRPPGCEHERCSFHGNFLVDRDGAVRSLGPGVESSGSCCGQGTDGEASCRTPGVVARQWSAAPQAVAEPKGEKPLGSLDAFLAQARGRTLAVSAMAFQDAWTLDLERLQGCCVHVASPDGRLVPFCAWNLTAQDGAPLHRGCRVGPG